MNIFLNFRSLFAMQSDDAQPPIAGNSGKSKSVRRELFEGDGKDYAGCDVAQFGNYIVRWEKQLRTSSTTGSKSGEAYKHGHVFMRIFVLDTLKGTMTELHGVDVTMQYLPSESPTTLIVTVYNFNLDAKGRSQDDRYVLEDLSYRAIMSMLRPKLAVIATGNLEIFCRVVGKQAHNYLHERYKLKINELGCAVFREGALLEANNYHGSRAQPLTKRLPASSGTVKRPGNDSLVPASTEVRPRVIFLFFLSSANVIIFF